MSVRGRHTTLGRAASRLLHRGFASFPPKLALALCCASPDVPILDWGIDPRTKRRPHKQFHGRRRTSSFGSLPVCPPWLLLILLGFSQIPCPVLAMDVLRLDALSSITLPRTPSQHVSAVPEFCEAQKACKFVYVPGPPPGPRPVRPPKDAEPTLGITIYAPQFIPTFFGLRMPHGTSLGEVIAEVFGACRHPGRGFDRLIPVRRQRHNCALSLLALPSLLGDCVPACCAVILDLSCVGGHYHAAIVHRELTRHELLQQIQPLIWHDVEDVEVWVDDAEFVASHGTLAFADGSVFTVLLPGNGPPLTYPAHEILSTDAVWGPLGHSPQPCRPVGDAVASPTEVFCLRWHMLSPLSLEGCVRKSLRLAAESCIRQTLRHMQLDVHGDYCRSVFVEAESGRPWLIDARAVGAPLRVHFGEDAPVEEQVRALLPFALPPEYSLVLTQDRHLSSDDNLRVVSVDVVVTDTTNFRHPPNSEAKLPSDATPALAQAVTCMEAQGLTGFLPQPFRRIGPIPPREDHDPETEPGDSDADSHDTVCKPTFCVLSPDVVPHVVKLTLEFPCTIDHALGELAEAIDAERYRFFPRLLEVRPQPSQFWALAVALPPWTHAESIVVFNLTRLDGRCFAAQIPNPFRRCHVLAAIGFAEDSDVDIFAFMRFRPMEPDQECEVIEGGSITVRYRGSAHVIQGHSLDVMLTSSIGWDPEPDLPHPPSGRRFCVVQENAFGFVTAEDPVEFAEPCVLRVLGLQAANLHTAQGIPELRYGRLFDGLTCHP